MTDAETFRLWLRLESRDRFAEAGALAAALRPDLFRDVVDIDEIKRRAEQP